MTEARRGAWLRGAFLVAIVLFPLGLALLATGWSVLGSVIRSRLHAARRADPWVGVRSLLVCRYGAQGITIGSRKEFGTSSALSVVQVDLHDAAVLQGVDPASPQARGVAAEVALDVRGAMPASSPPVDAFDIGFVRSGAVRSRQVFPILPSDLASLPVRPASPACLPTGAAHQP